MMTRKSKRHRLTQRMRTAYHEAGHAVACCVLSDRKFRHVTIKQSKDALGHVHYGKAWSLTDLDTLSLEDESDRKLIETRIMGALAGEAATYIVEGKRDPVGAGRQGGQASGDSRTVLEYLIEIFGIDEVPDGPQNSVSDSYKDFLWWRAVQELKSCWSFVEVVATALQKRETLTFAQCKRLIDKEQERLFPGAKQLAASQRAPVPHHALSLLLRNARGGTPRSEFAEKAGISVSTLRKLEKGNHDIRLSTLWRICTKLGWSISIDD